MNKNLETLGLMTFPEASERWNKERTYVFQMYTKAPEKFLKGSVISVGSGKRTWLITREGMEYFTKLTEAEANAKTWHVRHEKNWQIDFTERVDSEQQARELITKMVAAELNEKNIQIEFKELKPQTGQVVIHGNSIYTYEKKK